MEMKRIDNNTIQVLINQADLQQRGISLPDLMSNQERIEDFFYQILDEVDVDHRFSPDDALTFQARPLKNQGLELLISRVNRGDGAVPANIREDLTGYDRNQADYDEPAQEVDADLDEALMDPATREVFRVVSFADLEDFFAAAPALDTRSLQSDLYTYRGKYYLVLAFLNDGMVTANEIRDRLAVAYEFGQPTRVSAMVLKEHGQLMMEQTAIELARHYFD